MLLATTEQQIRGSGPWSDGPPTPAPIDVRTPSEVVGRADLDPGQKRAILAAWLSDASAVQDAPGLRWLLGTPEPVTVADLRAALEALDRQTDAGGRA